MPVHPEVSAITSRLAAATRHHPEQCDELRRDLRATQLRLYAEVMVSTWPPFTEDQKNRIIALLRTDAPVAVEADAS